MILVHEGGHFLAAKACGVRVLEFALGLGPAIFKKRFGETEYCLRALPFGGQCVMDGEDDDTPNDDPRCFNNAAPWRRIIILVAGVVMNFILGFLILLCLYAPAEGFVVPTIDSFMDKFTGGGEYGLQEGDTLLEIDGYNIYVSSDLNMALGRGDDSLYEIEIIRNGDRMTLHDVRIEPQPYELDGETVYYYGFYMQQVPATPGLVLKVTAGSSINMVRLVIDSLRMLFVGEANVTDLSGPVGISAMMSQTARQDMSSFWYLAALIAINLSVMNLLPIPALDGARILFVLYEIIARRRANPKVEGYIHGIGLLVMLGLIVFVTFNDIWRLITGSAFGG
ncbi:MAG: site-2 protease family protein [Clostridia bacterium]|nr:site-2 protease family protein [Clostridia bacterium]